MKKLLIATALLFLVGCGEKYAGVAEKGVKRTVYIQYVVTVDSVPVAGWLGTGVFISEHGHILTCAHILPSQEDYYMIEVFEVFGFDLAFNAKIETFDGVVFSTVTYMYEDREKDLGLIKVDYLSKHHTHLAKLTSPRVGQEVVAIGNPLGEKWSVTVGVISSLTRQVFGYDAFQTDAAINPGNSGGPLFDLDGNLLGINSATIPGANCIGFAVNLAELYEFFGIFYGLGDIYGR